MHIEICIEENSYMVFLYEGMAGRVQEFITIRIGSLWVDVPMGPTQVSNSASSLNTTAASPVVAAEDQEVNSKPTEGFTPVVTKAAKRRARRAAANARMADANECATSWRKAVPTNSVAPSSSKPNGVTPSSSKMAPNFRSTTLGEWPVRAKKAPSPKPTSPRMSSTSTPKIEG